jgi:hypothetical protein
MNVRENLYEYQRKWRAGVISRLKQRLGLFCHSCEGPDACQLPNRPRLELVFHNREAPELQSYGRNTITIYRHILAGKLPESLVTLLCPTCKYERRYGNGVSS